MWTAKYTNQDPKRQTSATRVGRNPHDTCLFSAVAICGETALCPSNGRGLSGWVDHQTFADATTPFQAIQHGVDCSKDVPQSELRHRPNSLRYRVVVQMSSWQNPRLRPPHRRLGGVRSWMIGVGTAIRVGDAGQRRLALLAKTNRMHLGRTCFSDNGIVGDPVCLS